MVRVKGQNIQRQNLATLGWRPPRRSSVHMLSQIVTVQAKDIDTAELSLSSKLGAMTALKPERGTMAFGIPNE